jgi:hypothetical protein
MYASARGLKIRRKTDIIALYALKLLRLTLLKLLENEINSDDAAEPSCWRVQRVGVQDDHSIVTEQEYREHFKASRLTSKVFSRSIWQSLHT